MSFSSWLARLPLRSRPATAFFIFAVSAIALAGHLTDEDEFGARQREASLDSGEQAERVLRDTSSNFNLLPTDCFLVVDAPKLFTPANLIALRNLVSSIEELDAVASVFWIDNVPVLNVFGLAPRLIPPDDSSPAAFAQAEADALEHPLVGSQWLSPDGTTTLVAISFDWLFVEEDSQVPEAIRKLAHQTLSARPNADFRVRLTGDVPLFLAQHHAFERNRTKFQLIGYSMVLVVAVVMFRGFVPVIIAAGAPAFGIFWTIGLLRFLGEHTNPLTNVVLPVLLAMIGIADGVHLMVTIRRRRSEGLSLQSGTERGLVQVAPACFLTSLTTAVGFASLMLAETDLVYGFGRHCAFGVLVMFAAVVTFIPLAATTRFAKNIHIGQDRDFIGRNLNSLAWLIDGVLLRRRGLSILGMIATGVLGATTFLLKPDSRLANALPSDSEAAQALEHCDQVFGGIEFARVIVEWPQEIPSGSPRILAAIGEVEGLVDNEPLIASPLSIRRILASFPGDAHDLENRMSLLDLMPDQIRDLFFDPESRRAMVSVRVQDLGLAEYAPVFQRVNQSLQELEKRHSGFQFRLTGDPVVRGRELYQIVVDLAVSLGTAAVVILSILTLAYRSIRIGLISVVPNMFPLAATASILFIAGRNLDISSVCAFTVCLGIAVDDTIHFLTRFLQQRQLGLGVEAAIRTSFFEVGVALIMTTVVMLTGFSAVLTSDLPSQRIFATMACCTIGAALFGDLIFLPALLARYSR